MSASIMGFDNMNGGDALIYLKKMEELLLVMLTFIKYLFFFIIPFSVERNVCRYDVTCGS